MQCPGQALQMAPHGFESAPPAVELPQQKGRSVVTHGMVEEHIEDIPKDMREYFYNKSSKQKTVSRWLGDVADGKETGVYFFSEPGSDMPPLSMWYLLFANRVRWHHLLIRNICATITLAISWSIYSWLQTRACHPIQLSSCETQTTWVWLSSLQVPPTGLRFGQRYMSIYGDQRTNDLARTSQGKAFILVQRDSTQSK